MISEKEKIKHLYNRAGFGLSAYDWNKNKFSQQIIDNFFHGSGNYRTLETVTLAEVEEARAQMKSGSKENIKDLKQLMKQNVFELNNLWFNEMVRSEFQLREKMALFWHGHFACRSVNPYFDQQYLDCIRRNALGNFSTLLIEVSKTPAMLQFLNNQQNKKDHPNENFAREVMELFTLGRGNYSEQDIKEAARAFTGFGFDIAGEFKFKIHQHDFGTKTFLGETGNFSGEDILKIILSKKECAYFITKKIYKFFVNDNVDESIVKELSEKFYKSGYNISQLMKEIFSSEWFYDEKNIAVKIKSPVELLAGMFRIVPAMLASNQSLLFMQRALGQVLLNPPNVSGWSGGRSWIDSSSLLFRMRLPQVIYYDKELDFSPKEETPEMGMRMKASNDFVLKLASGKLNAETDWKNVLEYFSNLTTVVNDITSTILAGKPNSSALKCIQSNSDNSNKENQIKSVMIDVLSLPDYQLC